MAPPRKTIELPPTYDPKAVEERLYDFWERSGFFHEEPDPARPPFIIPMPPPNVTGRAHLGHGSTYTPQDVLTRYHRMLGEDADWLPGLDHAAIATEAVLVRELAAAGISRDRLGRDGFVARAWEWSNEYGGTINAQFRKLGFGPDWQRERFTMDERLSAAVRKVFVALYREGLIYRGKRLINWDPKGQTTVSDAEIDHLERDSYLWHIRYDAKDGAHALEIATTRPETMLGDVAVAVHPSDERYRDLIGASVVLPLIGREIPVIADEAVDRSFGTGAVKVTPAHDATDYEIGLRHRLPMPTIMDEDARISDAEIAVGPYAGLDRYEARARIIEDLRASGNLIKEEPYRHAVAISERSGEVIEPLLSLQWFVTMKPLAEPALRAYRDGRLRFVPERYGRTYEQWLENIRDWNISRQLWWGHQLPVWYTPGGDVVVAETEEEAREIARTRFGGAPLARDPDTLDTWFSSGLWPFSILGWPERTLELQCWYPSQVLITGWEIIFLWVARMVMLGMHFLGEVPFPTVFIAPLVFDAQGRKMSKSLGNAIDPMDLVDRYGADATRMGILRQMRLEGQEIRFQESRCEEARNFNNKIWNATRYMLALPEGLPGAMTLPKPAELTVADKWILTRLHELIATVGERFEAFDFGNAAEALWRFVWYEFCDWYVEATKVEGNRTTRAAVLSFVWNNAMRVLHPVEPFISEEVWLALPHDGSSIVTASWPDRLEVPVDHAAAAAFEVQMAVTERIRRLKVELALPLGSKPLARVPFELGEAALQAVTALTPVLSGSTIEVDPELHGGVAAVLVEAPRALLLERYKKDAAHLRAEVERGERKLANPQFVAKAAPEVVAKEREKLDGYRSELARVESALAAMGEPA
ncbi:MAG TPA: valine--tRNA ligase [Candidatus Baltobacteraceae bacterium]|nr:valine--tRNA ligase [Candidatus Baltobacteraceae bacterium]